MSIFQTFYCIPPYFSTMVCKQTTYLIHLMQVRFTQMRYMFIQIRNEMILIIDFMYQRYQSNITLSNVPLHVISAEAGHVTDNVHANVKHNDNGLAINTAAEKWRRFAEKK